MTQLESRLQALKQNDIAFKTLNISLDAGMINQEAYDRKWEELESIQENILKDIRSMNQ